MLNFITSFKIIPFTETLTEILRALKMETNIENKNLLRLSLIKSIPRTVKINYEEEAVPGKVNKEVALSLPPKNKVSTFFFCV